MALGLILAQDPDLFILDDYSMGLDAGYRRLFIDYLNEYVKSEHKTVFVTSHIIQDLEDLLDELVIIDNNSVLLSMSTKEFRSSFKKYNFEIEDPHTFKSTKNNIIKNYEIVKKNIILYSFKPQEQIEDYLIFNKIKFTNIKEIPMTLEDAFIGLTGKY